MQWNEIFRLVDAVDSKMWNLGFGQPLSNPVLREARNAIKELRNIGTLERFIEWKKEVGFVIPDEYLESWITALERAALFLFLDEYDRRYYI